MSKQISNILWLLIDKFIKLGTSVYIFSLIARNYSVDEFGLLNLALAVIAIFSAVASVGLNGILVNEYIKHKNNQEEIVSTALALRISFGIVSYICYSIVVYFFVIKGLSDLYLFLILGLRIIFSFSDAIRSWFESQVEMKYVIFVESIILIISSFFKVGFIYFGVDIEYLSCLFTVETLFIAITLVFVFIKIKKKRLKKPIAELAVILFKKGSPLIVASLAWIVYTRLDQIMLGAILSHENVAYYAAASHLSDIIGIVPVICITTFTPYILSLSKDSVVSRDDAFGKLYGLIFLVSLIFVFLVILSAPLIINILYGANYQPSIIILQIHVFSLIFVSFANITGRYLILKELQSITMKRHLIGLILNFVLNLVLIPIYGSLGAAYATLISLIFVNYFYDIFSSSTRICFIQKSKALVLYDIFNSISFFKLIVFSKK